MNESIVEWARQQKTGSAAEKVTLAVLAFRAGFYGESRWTPELLARETDQPLALVAERLKELEALGLIAVTVAPRIAGARRTIVVLHDEGARAFARQLRGTAPA